MDAKKDHIRLSDDVLFGIGFAAFFVFGIALTTALICMGYFG